MVQRTASRGGRRCIGSGSTRASFSGPVLSGLLAERSVLWIVGVATAGALVVVSGALLRAREQR